MNMASWIPSWNVQSSLTSWVETKKGLSEGALATASQKIQSEEVKEAKIDVNKAIALSKEGEKRNNEQPLLLDDFILVLLASSFFIPSSIFDCDMNDKPLI